MQASHFGGAFDQLFLWTYLCIFHRRCLSTFSIPWCKKVKMTKNSNQGVCLRKKRKHAASEEKKEKLTEARTVSLSSTFFFFFYSGFVSIKSGQENVHETSKCQSTAQRSSTRTSTDHGWHEAPGHFNGTSSEESQTVRIGEWLLSGSQNFWRPSTDASVCLRRWAVSPALRSRSSEWEKKLSIDGMPDKSWRGMRAGPVTRTALCISYTFPDCIQTFASCFICSGVQLTWIFSSGFVLKHPYIHANAFLLAGIRKRCHFETAIKVNAQAVCITKPSPVAAPFVCSSLPCSFPLQLSSLHADHEFENIFSFHSPGLQLSERINITFTL